MTTITNVGRELAEHILGQYDMSFADTLYVLNQARNNGVWEGTHKDTCLKITSASSRYTIQRA